MRIVIFGSTGLLGSYIEKYFKLKYYTVITVNRCDIDIEKTCIQDIIKNIKLILKKGDYIINCIGLTNKIKKDENTFIKINSIFPQILSNICEINECYLFQPSTDCIFDGISDNIYNINDNATLHDIYGTSKYFGEPSNKNTMVFRVSIIGENKSKKSLLEWLKSMKNKYINGYINHYWNGITCLEYAQYLEKIIFNLKFKGGTYHLYSLYNGEKFITKYELLCIINDIYNLNIKINPIKSNKKCDRRLDGIQVNKSLEKQIIEMWEFDILNERKT